MGNLTPFIVQWGLTSLSLWVASYIFSGLRFADGGSLTNSFSNEAGDWTVQIKSGTATVDALNKQITFSSDNSENLAIITTADGTSHEITNVDKILWH